MPEHQGSRRVGPPQRTANRCGFLEPSLIIMIGGIIYMTAALWAFVFTHSGDFNDVKGGSSACMECR